MIKLDDLSRTSKKWKALLEITSCRDCPYSKVTNVSSTDGWDRGEEYTCTKSSKVIHGFVEWNDDIPVPEWCPIGVTYD
jgi:hypothetical protein